MSEDGSDLKSFEGSFNELEDLVRKLEGGALTLDESLAHYERGVAALKRCYRILEVAERRLEVLVREGDGTARTRPLDLAEVRGEARGAARVAPASPVPAPAPAPAPAPDPPRVSKIAPPVPAHDSGERPSAPASAAIRDSGERAPVAAEKKAKGAPAPSGPQGGSLF